MSLLAPSMQRYGSSHSQHDVRSASRADSVLDYYVSGASSREVSPNRLLKTAMNGSREKVSQSSLSRIGSPNSYRHSDSFNYDEFGYDSRYQAIVEARNEKPETATTLFPAIQNDATDPTKSTAIDNGSFKRVYSLSRIPVPRDRYSNHSIAGEATRIPYQAKPKDNLSETAHHEAAEHHTVPQLTLNDESTLYKGIPRSTSMPLNQLAKLRTSFDDPGMNKFGSLPARKARSNNQSGMQRSASLTENTRQTEFKDYRALREEQARRIQLINQAPSGPPPWLGKFQPDPRLPAEQQMLPTVARKLALGQWIEDGGAEESFDSMWETHKTWTSPASKRASAYEPPALSTTQEEQCNDEFQSPPLAHSPRLSYTPQLEPQQSPILGQNPSTSLHRQTSSFGTNMPNFSRRSVHNVGTPQLVQNSPHARTDSSGPSSDRRLTDATEQLAVAPLPSENRGLGLVDLPKTTVSGQAASSTAHISQNPDDQTTTTTTTTESRHRQAPAPAPAPKAGQASIAAMHRHADPRVKREAKAVDQRKIEKKARCCVVM
ncbi:Putative uncharacterized protein [Taphrina deformans PYCC 5710]|uniref:Uncharacterized protein n=1 Tax=Taphrina deformans (strain PYCC 5710 / ATCC 11124 / CBS 356.35 / IMI 108563 / JCM 9778 / NBRC 8474) TaxID=1097556 RepID=R4XBQ0_TAPDE|nr:Putative uncharacterized protein [Taphrina deformans PYCC 5710]|eukprot:CCG83218.1 Putative uncharacterized protein [Taphrina deformans PYCC 5710]